MITLASKRYTIAALGSTLDSRYPNGGASGFTPEAGFTVSGAFADGGSISIAKSSGFGADGPTIVLWDDFRDSTVGQVISSIPVVGSYSSVGSAVCVSTARSHGKAAALLANELAYILRANFTGSNTAFVSYWVFVPVGKALPGRDINGYSVTTGTGSDWKCAWLMYGPDSDSNVGEPDICVPTQVNDFFTVDGNESSMGQLTQYQSVSGAHTYGEWLRCAVLIDGANGKIWTQLLSASKGIIEDSATGLDIFGATTPQTFGNLTVPGYVRSGEARTDVELIYDELYVATGAGALASVEITNSATYASSTEIAVCRPSAWSDAEITVTIEQSAHASLPGKHLHIRKADGSMLYAGSFV